MHSGGEFQALTRKHKHHHNHFTEPHKKSGQVCNNAQILNKSVKAPSTGTANVAYVKFQKYESNLAEMYYKKYGRLCNHIPSASRSIRGSSPVMQHIDKLYPQKKNENNTNYKKCGHISKRSNSPNKNIVHNANNVPQNNNNSVKQSVNKYIVQQNTSNNNNLSKKNENNAVAVNIKSDNVNKNVENSNKNVQNANPVAQHVNASQLPKNNTSEINNKCNLVQKKPESSNKDVKSIRPQEQKSQNMQDTQNVQITQNAKNPQNVQNAQIVQNIQNVQNSQNIQKIQNVPEQKTHVTEIHQICIPPNKNVEKKNNKNIKNVVPSEQSANNSVTQKNNQITEIYKRSENKNAHHSIEDLTAELATEKTENVSFHKVTQDLANIIKNLQKQIHEVPINKSKMEEVPSAMIQPKIKEFFKEEQKSKPSTPKPASPNNKNNNNSKNINNINCNNNTNSNHRIYRGSTSSLGCFGRSTIPPRGSHLSPRRFSSSTHPALLLRKSSSSNRRISSSLSIDPLKLLKDEVHKAIREHKTFTVRGQFSPIRKALLARGWVEKFHISYKDHLNEELKRYQSYAISELLPLMKKEELTATCKNLIKSKLLGGYQVDFYWGSSDEAFKENPDKIKLTIINKLKREIFSYTNKQGLCEASKYSYWYQKSNVSKLNHPRSYSLTAKNGELKGFTEDFNMTAAMSLLKWIVKTNITRECKLISPSGKVPLEAFEFALNECCKFIKRCKHEDIDTHIPEASDHEWNKFLEYFYKIVHYSNHFAQGGGETADSLVRKSNYILNTLKEIWPYVDMDGMMNIWILKPTASSRGRGIHMCRTLQYVLRIIKQNSNIRYIIQKYIERPLLIHNTKFDIRQWFLISNCSPLTIWMYKECYLRFSSQTYNLRKLHESIHLTNNSVQCKYKNASIDAALPSFNMWDSNDFQKYLTNIGYSKAFKNIIYPGMKQCITAAVLMHQDKMVIRRNCFELYGADFILTEDFQPWLLEINSNPALYASTPVTSRMCPKVLDDVIKVVIDYAHNIKANTGGFEMIYKEQMSKLPSPSALEVKGLPLKRDYFYHGPNEQQKAASNATSYNPIWLEQEQECLKSFSEEIKKTLKNLLEIIHHEKHKRELKNKNSGCYASLPCKTGGQSTKI